MRILALIAFTLLASTSVAENLSQELECLARNIYFESRGEPVDGQYAVAFVTLNRVEDPRWADTICDVVYEPSQFSWTSRNNTSINEQVAWTRAQTIARSAYYQYYHFGEDTTDGAVFFNRGRRQRYHTELKISIGNHNFYS